MDNKRIIVVGASRGLGRGVAAALAGAGARVLAIGRDTGALEELKQQSEGRVEWTAGDATNPSFVARVLSDEDPDGVFIVLGATPVMRPIHQYRWESFSDVWNTDVKATFHWLQDLVNKPMRAGGRIVVFSSGAAINGSPWSGGYAASKQAQRNLCDSMRGELAVMKRDITIQCILPQLNPNTDVGRVAVAAYAARAGESPAEYMKKRFGDKPLSSEIAGAEMVRLLDDDDLLGESEFVLAGTGLAPLKKK
jgi:NAD(P)-dependent dehydrogenase (short-subunit alcohol dehydrogenase family)